MVSLLGRHQCWYKLLLPTIKSLGFITVKAGNVPKLFAEHA